MRIGRIRRDAGSARVEVTGRGMLVVSLLMAIPVLGMAAATVWVADTTLARIPFVAATLFFGVIALVTFTSSRRATVPVVTVYNEGIEHPQAGMIQWHDIASIREFETPRGQKMVGIWLADPYLLARRGGWWLWPFAFAGSVIKAPAIAVSDSMVPLEELLAEIERLRPR